MNILIAVDDSDESLDAAHVAYSMFGEDADYVIISVGDNPTPMVPVTPMGITPTYRMVERERAVIENQARAAAEAARAQLPADARVAVDVEAGPAGATICDVAEEIVADVVVIGSHDRGFWDRLFTPSIGRYLVEHAPCPVLVVR